MLTLDFMIEDVHGNQHANAVIFINNINYASNQSHQSSLNLSQTPPTRMETHSNTTFELNFNAYLYPDLAAAQTKKVPMPLRSKSGNDWHTLRLEGPVSDTSTFEHLCEQFVLTTILPTLKVQSEV